MPAQPDSNSSVQHGHGLTGLLVIDKPPGLTSMDVVAQLRRKAGGARTGHAGTLDPLATGVLVVAIGRATKFIDRLMNTTKRYLTAIDLSAFTTTDDLEGPRTDIPVETPPDERDIRTAINTFIGSIQQRPPAFSAMKVEGVRAYKLARRGQRVDIPPRQVVVHSLNLLKYHWPLVELQIHCDKGFYVRRLARDLGETLHAGGHCVTIRRTAVGPFTLGMAKPLAHISAPLQPTDLITLEEAARLLQQDSPNSST